MLQRTSAAVLAAIVCVSPVLAQTKTGKNAITYDVTVTAEGVPYVGTMVLTIAGGKVSGAMHIKQPTVITGNAAGTAKGNDMTLDFPYRMVERECDGRIVMAIKLPAKKGAAPATGTVEISGCGRPENNILHGTIELKPAK